jgi:hypothetical protein
LENLRGATDAIETDDDELCHDDTSAFERCADASGVGGMQGCPK